MAAPDRSGSKQSSKKAAPPPPPASPNRLYAIIGGLTVVGIGVIYYLVQAPRNVSIPIPTTIAAADTAGFQGYYLGAPDAKVVVTEYADYQCPACQSFEMLQFDVVKRDLIDAGKIRYRYRDFPLDQIHPYARLAAHSAACGEEQGKYWEYHRIIYENQPSWSASRSASGLFRDYAKQAGLDQAKYDACMQGGKYAGRLEASLKEGLAVGVGSTPSFVIGGRLYRGAMTSDSVIAIVGRLAADSAK